MTGEITLVAAVARNGVIGAHGGVPWHLPHDLRRAKELTMGHPLVMGRRTYETIGRPLPGRTSVVVTRDPAWTPAREHMGEVVVTHSVAEALRRCVALPGGEDVMVFGGGEIYAQAMDAATRLEITWVDVAPEGDTRFPPIDPTRWAEVGREEHEGYAFVTYRSRGRPDRADGPHGAAREPVPDRRPAWGPHGRSRGGGRVATAAHIGERQVTNWCRHVVGTRRAADRRLSCGR